MKTLIVKEKSQVKQKRNRNFCKKTTEIEQNSLSKLTSKKFNIKYLKLTSNKKNISLKRSNPVT